MMMQRFEDSTISLSDYLSGLSYLLCASVTDGQGVQPEIESVRIDSKTVVFIRANPGKKETTDGSGLCVNFIRDWCPFPEVVSSEKWHVTKNFEFAVTGKISFFPDR